jgi:hypothetical protein
MAAAAAASAKPLLYKQYDISHVFPMVFKQ